MLFRSFVSTISRDSQKALGATLVLMLLLVAGGPAVDSTFAVIKRQNFHPVASLSSPGYLFVAAGAPGQLTFWPGLLTNQAIAWTLLSLACLLLPRSWQERAAKTSTGNASPAYTSKFGGGKRRAMSRRKLLDLNPVLWLACRQRWQIIPFWAVAILLLGGFAAMFASRGLSGAWFVWSYLANAIILVLYLGIASQAGRFFVGAKRSGLIELLLATPLTVKQVWTEGETQKEHVQTLPEAGRYSITAGADPVNGLIELSVPASTADSPK